MRIRDYTRGIAALMLLGAFSSVAGAAQLPAKTSAKTDAAKKPLYVTVRKRAEPEKSIPQTVQVFRKDDISALRLQSPTDIASSVSGFSFNDPFGRFNPAPSMRGLIQPGLGDEPSVAFFNDGLYLSGRSSINSLGFDLEGIETAKGPQNALYGRNSFGGAINAASAKPTKEVERFIDVLYGTKDRKQATAVVSGPITDTLMGRLALYDRDWGGFFKNTTPNGPDIGGEKTLAGRASLRYQPDATRDVILRLTRVHDDDDQPKGFLVPANCGPRVSDGVLRYYCGDLPESGAPYEANKVGNNGYTRTHTRLGLDWNEKLSNETALLFTLGGSAEESRFARDDDYSSQQAARAGIDARRNDVQADARVTYTPQGQDWDALAGISLYRFFNHTRRMDQYYVLGQTRPGGAVTDSVTHTAALYGSLSHGLPHDFKITLDGRYQKEWKKFDSSVRDLSGTMLDLSDNWGAFTPKITLSWQQTPESLLAYVSAARGYKSGGFNDRQNIYDSQRVYGPEVNWTYEAGLKNIPIATGLTLDAGVFYIDWIDQQVLAYSAAGTTNNFFLDNDASSTVKGIETGLHWQIRDHTKIGIYYTYADAQFDKYNDPDLAGIVGYAPNGDVSGNQLPRYSPHHIGAEIQNRIPLEYQHWDWVNTAQLSFQSSQYTDNANYAKTGNRTLLNLQTGVSRGAVYAGFFVDNALNERDPSVGISWSDATTGFSRAWLVVPQDGRTFGVRAKVKF